MDTIISNNNKQTALIWLCYNRMDKIAMTILKTKNIYLNINHLNNNNESALFYACINKMEDVAVELIKQNKSLGLTPNVNGVTPYDCACENKLNKVIKLLANDYFQKKKQDLDKKYKKIQCKNKYLSWIINNQKYSKKR